MDKQREKMADQEVPVQQPQMTMKVPAQYSGHTDQRHFQDPKELCLSLNVRFLDNEICAHALQQERNLIDLRMLYLVLLPILRQQFEISHHQLRYTPRPRLPQINHNDRVRVSSLLPVKSGTESIRIDHSCS